MEITKEYHKAARLVSDDPDHLITVGFYDLECNVFVQINMHASINIPQAIAHDEAANDGHIGEPTEPRKPLEIRKDFLRLV